MSFALECEVCHKEPQKDGIGIYRTGEKGPGKNPHWRCKQHLDDNVIDPNVDEIVTVIEESNHGLA